MTTKKNMGGEKKDNLLLKILMFIAVGVALRLVLNGPLTDGTISGFIQGLGVWAPTLFISTFALGVVILLPPRLFIGLGAIVFGKTYGPLYCLISLTIGGCAAFLAGRYLATDLTRKLIKGRMKKVDALAEFQGLSLVLYLRLIFFGTPMLNYIVSSTRLSFKDYLFGSVIGLIPFVVLFSYSVDVLLTAKTIRDILTDPIVFGLPALRIIGAGLLMMLNKKSRLN